MKHYSPSTKGFYDKHIHGDNIPSDCIIISDEEHQYLLDNQSDTHCIGVKDDKVTLLERVKTQEEIDNEYKVKRKAKYPSIPDQLDMLWHLMDNEEIPGKGTDWYNTISDVKTKYPKP